MNFVVQHNMTVMTVFLHMWCDFHNNSCFYLYGLYKYMYVNIYVSICMFYLHCSMAQNMPLFRVIEF